MDEPKHPPIFISHASADDAFVRRLRTYLEALGLPVWVDSRNLRGGDKLADGIEKAIRTACQVLVVLSPNTVNSPWVRREIRLAEQVAAERGGDYRVTPLLLDGIEPSALALWFDQEPVGVPVKADSAPGGLIQALPAILAALGEQLPDDFQAYTDSETRPLEELLLELSDPRLVTEGQITRVRATAELTYQAANPDKPAVRSRRFTFTFDPEHGLAGALIRLGRLDQARPELLRAIECKKPYGHAALPWTTWEILHNLEQATGHLREARAARQQAMDSFLAYRRAGGEN